MLVRFRLMTNGGLETLFLKYLSLTRAVAYIHKKILRRIAAFHSQEQSTRILLELIINLSHSAPSLTYLNVLISVLISDRICSFAQMSQQVSRI
jgi:hypothetical protein